MQSVMFSSTLQVLECYRDSPTSSTYSKSEYGINLQDTPRSAMPVYDSKPFTDYHQPPSPGTSSFPTSAEASPSNSPASSQTSAFSDSSFLNTSGPLKELRRRRSPTDTEPRPKDLKLFSSNGQTKFDRNDFAAAAANSEWEKPLPEPSPIPPPPPPKNILRDAISRNLIQASNESIMGNKGSKESSGFGMRKESVPDRGKTLTITTKDSPPPKLTIGLRSPPSLKLIVPQNEAPFSLPPRVDSMPKNTQSGPNPNFPNPKQGLRRPTHKKTASISSNLDKELPAKPPLEPLPPTPKTEKELPDIKEAQQVFQESDLSKDMTFRTHTRGKSNTALNILKSLSPGPTRNKPGPLSPESDFPAHPPLPTLPAANTSPASSASQTSTIRRKLPSPMPAPLQPNEPWHDRTTSQGSAVSDLTTASFAPAPFGRPQPPPMMPLPLLKVEEPSPVQPFHYPTDLDDNGNFMIPQKRFPVPPMPLTHIHYDCYTKHRPLAPSKNILAAVLCMVCKEDSDQMWKCGWCCLRICGSCRQALGTKRGDLRKLLEEGRGPQTDGSSRKPPSASSGAGSGFVPRSRPFGSDMGGPAATGRGKIMI